MHLSRKSVLTLLCLASALGTSTPVLADTLGVGFDGGFLTYTGPGSVGFEFTPNRDIYVTALGVYDTSALGVGLATETSVGLYNAGGSQLGSAQVPSSSAIKDNGFIFQSVSPLHLFANQTYTIGAYLPSGLVVDADDVRPSGDIAFGGIAFKPGSSLSKPGRINESGGLFGPSFEYSLSSVPEPATWGMMVAGFGLMGAVMRRRQRVAVSFA